MPTKRGVKNLTSVYRAEFDKFRSCIGDMEQAVDLAVQLTQAERFDYTATQNAFMSIVADSDAHAKIVATIGMMAYEPLVHKETRGDEDTAIDMMAVAYHAIMMYKPTMGVPLYAYVRASVEHELYEEKRCNALIERPRARSIHTGQSQAASALVCRVGSLSDSVTNRSNDDGHLTLEDTLAASVDTQPDEMMGVAEFGKNVFAILQIVSEIYSFDHALACGVRCRMNDSGKSFRKSESAGDDFVTEYRRWQNFATKLVGNGFSAEKAHEVVLKSMTGTLGETVSWVRAIDAYAYGWYLDALQTAYVEYTPDCSTTGKSAPFEYVTNVFGDLSKSRGRTKMVKKRLAFATALQLRGFDSVAKALQAAV